MNSTAQSSSSSRPVSRRLRELRVVTDPRRSNKSIRTRTMSEMIFMSPRNSPRVTPRSNRLEMDIEISSPFARGNGVRVNWMNASASEATSMDNNESNEAECPENAEEEQPEAEAEPTTNECDASGRPADVGGVIDMLFEIHTALKTRHLGQRTAASALAASNLVSTVAFPKAAEAPRDEQLEALENTRRMLECAICQDIFTEATEAGCCGQIFCRECIERWVGERASCPMCRDPVTVSMLSASRHAQRMANEMIVPCPWCDSSMKKSVLKEHMGVCEKAPLEPPPPADVVLRRSLLNTGRVSTSAFRMFLTVPSPPQAEMTQCYIRSRNRGHHFELYTLDGDVLLATAVRKRSLDMSTSFVVYMGAISLNDSEVNEGDDPLPEHQVGRIERNFVGSQYTIYSTSPNDSNSGAMESAEMGAVQYAATFGKTPRQMRVAVPTVEEQQEGQWAHNSQAGGMLAQIENPDPTRSVSMLNKPPVWIESLEAYCLDFGGRVAAASVKNFLLARPDDMDTTMMLFGRTVDRNVYSMDFRHPLSPLQSFSIALSSMDSHLVTFD